MKRRFIQRELSWVAFNARVLHEGLREDTALLDRIKFMAITSSNFDEFFKVRIARLMRDIEDGDHPYPPDDDRPSAILRDLLSEIRQIICKMERALTEDIFPKLAQEGIVILPAHQWGKRVSIQAHRIFEQELLSIATPVVINDTNLILNHALQERLYAAFSFSDKQMAFVRIPENIERLRVLRSTPKRREIVLLEDILLTYAESFFPGHVIESRCLFRITRDAEITVNEERDEDFITAMEEVLESRKTSFSVRLETFGDKTLADAIRAHINLPKANHFHLTIPLGFKEFLALSEITGYGDFYSRLPSPKPPEDINENDNIWETLKDRDVLVHHPFESYWPIIHMVESAASDPATLAIKMTLYRTSGDSPIVAALIRAAERGIQVTVLIELKARFDEDANIHWAIRLQQAGAIVVYGLSILKVHAKLLMVVRREETGIQQFLHLSTGNYNDSTARLYTDISLFTSREDFTQDAALIFNAITGYSSVSQLQTLFMAPFSLRKETLRLIRREMNQANAGEPAMIMAKMNALVDKEIIEALYDASCSGVVINLNIRGICCLRPGVKNMSENIRVVSIIDSFLEHTRAFVYLNGGNREVYLSSADWMPRNLDRRVELLFPIPSKRHRDRIASVIEDYFRDNTRSWELQDDGSWKAMTPDKGKKPFRIQSHLAESVAVMASKKKDSERHELQVRRNLPAASRQRHRT